MVFEQCARIFEQHWGLLAELPNWETAGAEGARPHPYW